MIGMRLSRFGSTWKLLSFLSDSSHSEQYIAIVRIENLRSEAESIAGKRQIFNVSINLN